MITGERTVFSSIEYKILILNGLRAFIGRSKGLFSPILHKLAEGCGGGYFFSPFLFFGIIAFAAFSTCRSAEGGGIKIPSSMTHYRTLLPGQTVKGSIPLTNTGEKQVALKVYQVDYRYLFDGTTYYLEPGTLPRSNGNWIKFQPENFDLPPGETGRISYRIEVPRDSQLAGTYWSILFVEPQQLEQGVGGEKESSFTINSIIRYGFQIVVQVGESGEYDLKILGYRTRLDEKKNRSLLVDIENSGTRFIKPSIWVEFFDERGKSCGKFEGRAMKLHPTCSVSYNIDITPLARGDYNALILLDGGEEAFFGAQKKITVE